MGSDDVANADPSGVPGPVAALREVAFWLEREQAVSRRAMAYRKAADALESLGADDLAVITEQNLWRSLPGLGESTSAVARAAAQGQVSQTLAELRARGEHPLADSQLASQLRGDLHVHTHWSDGSASLAQMADAARMIGREYLAITDHSPRTRIARGLDEARRSEQIAAIAALQPETPVQLLTGIEVDILDDGSLDQAPEMLARLDVVVASVHSKLAMEPTAMTRRLVAAIANPNVDVLGHPTGQLVSGERGTRAASTFDAEVVFAACAQFGVAVEINSRPERADPPDELLIVARDAGCLFSIDTDAHAPGQLDFAAYGAARAQAHGIAAASVITTWDHQKLMAHLGSRG